MVFRWRIQLRVRVKGLLHVIAAKWLGDELLPSCDHGLRRCLAFCPQWIHWLQMACGPIKLHREPWLVYL